MGRRGLQEGEGGYQREKGSMYSQYTVYMCKAVKGEKGNTLEQNPAHHDLREEKGHQEYSTTS